MYVVCVPLGGDNNSAVLLGDTDSLGVDQTGEFESVLGSQVVRLGSEGSSITLHKEGGVSTKQLPLKISGHDDYTARERKKRTKGKR